MVTERAERAERAVTKNSAKMKRRADQILRTGPTTGSDVVQNLFVELAMKVFDSTWDAEQCAVARAIPRAIDAYRAEKRRPAEPLAEDSLATDHRHEMLLDSLRSAVKELEEESPDLHRIIHALYVDGCELEELAHQFDRSVQTLYRWRKEAIVILHEKLKPS